MTPRDLIKQGLEHDERMDQAPWGERHSMIMAECGPAGSSGDAYAVCNYGEDDATDQEHANAAGIAWLRNNARALLIGYAAALDRVLELEAKLKAATSGAMDRVIESVAVEEQTRVIMQRETERDAARAEANRNLEMARVAAHARDVARVRVAELERESERLRAELAKFKEYDWNAIHDSIT